MRYKTSVDLRDQGYKYTSFGDPKNENPITVSKIAAFHTFTSGRNGK